MYEKTELLIGHDKMTKLKKSNVLIVGLGGVGGCVFEMLVRIGIGNLTVVDDDIFEHSNLNRQILSNIDNIGKSKAHVAYIRGKSINKNINIKSIKESFDASNADKILTNNGNLRKYDLVLDCIDRVRDKIELILGCNKYNLKCISALSAGNRMDINFYVDDIFNTYKDPLAKILRRELRKKDIKKHLVVYSKSNYEISNEISSISYVTNAMGCKISEVAIKMLLN